MSSIVDVPVQRIALTKDRVVEGDVLEDLGRLRRHEGGGGEGLLSQPPPLPLRQVERVVVRPVGVVLVQSEHPDAGAKFIEKARR